MKLLKELPYVQPINIQFTHYEANLLLAMVQNPLPNESEEVLKLRSELFDTLRSGLSGV